VKDHILPAFLATEKAMIFGHVGKDIPHRAEVIKLFKSQTSGDELLKMAVFPILITYESISVASFTEVSAEYINKGNRRCSQDRRGTSGDPRPDKEHEGLSGACRTSEHGPRQ
jgi:hypothetical protein